MGGLLGIVLLGVFAGTAINPNGAQGLVHGSATFFAKQIAAGVGCSAYAFAFTYVMLKVIDRITPVRVGVGARRGSMRRSTVSLRTRWGSDPRRSTMRSSSTRACASRGTPDSTTPTPSPTGSSARHERR